MTALTCVHSVSSTDALHVVFVHGLEGNERSTWMHKPRDPTTLWPHWVGQDMGCNVWVAGYNAAVSRWTNSAMHLSELGEALFSALQVERDLQSHSIVLIGHSLGGLVIKSGMTQAQTLGDPLRLKLLERIAAVVFVGTPHQGSNLATLADKLRFPLRTNAQVVSMVSHDPWLKILNSQFRALHEQRKFGVRVFYESKGVFIGLRLLGISIGFRQTIVDRNSSDPGITGVNPTAIEGDHIEIAKPRSRQAYIHKALLDFLEDVRSRQNGASQNDETQGNATFKATSDVLKALKSASSPLLSWPSTLPDGTWIDRPELDSLIERLESEASSCHFLLGEPGCGKSALLVRLAQNRQAAGWCVLAIKADRLPPDVLDRQALTRNLNLEADVATVLRALAVSMPVLVLIDQLDALADLVVQQSARLRVLLDLVQDLSGATGIHTVISCRAFEQKHDPALRNLDATDMRLELPEWPAVQPVLLARGLRVDLWSREIQQVLLSPHALDIFLSLLASKSEPEVLRSFQGLLEKQWEAHVLTDKSGRRRETLHYIAKLMASREVLGLPIVQVESHYTEIQQLAAVGLLRLDLGPGRVEFRHQTLYEFVRARSFLEESGSLTETVRAQQGSLRIRPQLWHALGYFRSASPEEYGVEIGRLWSADLRPHLKMLLVEFLGLQTKPTAAECQLVEHAIHDQWFMPRFIGSAVGSAGWFARLLPAHLPKLMSLPLEQARFVLPMLREALHFCFEDVVSLVRRHWLNDPHKDLLSWQVLGVGDVAPQLGPWLESLLLIVRRTAISEWAIGHVAGVLSAESPEQAPKLIAAWFKRQIDSGKDSTGNTSIGDGISGENVRNSVQAAFEARQFHDMEAIAEAAPKSFVLEMWPLLVEALQQFALEASCVVIGYRKNSGLMFLELDDEDANYERPILRSIQLGVQSWANADPDDFLDFVEVNASSEVLLIHRLLALGLLRVAPGAPQRVYNYLCGDPRRLVLGPYTDVHKESASLIATICPLLDGPSYAGMEAMLLDWRYYKEAPQDDASTRHQRRQWDRQHRLRLLRALPQERRSAGVRRLVDEEERAFPDLADKDFHSLGFQWIGSPLSAEQMVRATDEDVLNLFNELTDDTEWDHPRHRMKGGAIQAGRELAAMTKLDLAKALRIVRSLDPLRNEIPVSCALGEIVAAGLSASQLYALVAELEDRGFAGPIFRRDAAYAIAKAACKESPVPNELIDRIECWLTPWVPGRSAEIKADPKETPCSFLWGTGSIAALPNGNYPVLMALTSACLSAEPARFDRWVSILERHASRAESAEVWGALFQRELVYLRMGDRARSEALIDRVIAAAPSSLDGPGWVRFVAHAFHWASGPAVRRWIMGTIENAASGGQGAGELACLRHALFPAELWSRDLVEVLCRDAGSDAALGVAHTVANLWHEPMTRPAVHPVLLKLLQSSDERVLWALSAVFLNDGFTADVATGEFLDTLVAYPDILNGGRTERLPEMLVKLVGCDPGRVCKVAHALLDVAGDQMRSISTAWYLSAEWLLDIALRLQDMGPDQRAAGSLLFERMLEFNIPQAREMTLDLDKRMPVGSSPRAPVRRRSRAKIRNSGQ